MSEYNIINIKTDKRRYLPLLLLADEQESMIDCYLDRGELFVMEGDGKAVAVAVVTVEDSETIELKNLAVTPELQGNGLGRRMIDFIRRHYAADYRTLLVGTGDVPTTVGFYERCGFHYAYRVADFFTTHYDHPIYEEGVLLRDMVYLRLTIES